MARRLTRLAALAALLAACAAGAAPFADPTRPPGAGGEGDSERDGAASGPRLESVLLSPQRKLAVISGREVRLGERFGEGRVVRITPVEVAIQRDGEIEVLKLYPDFRKHPEAKTK